MSDSKDMNSTDNTPPASKVESNVAAVLALISAAAGVAFGVLATAVYNDAQQPLVAVDASFDRGEARRQIAAGELPRELFDRACSAAVNRLYSRPSRNATEELGTTVRFVYSAGSGPSGTR